MFFFVNKQNISVTSLRLDAYTMNPHTSIVIAINSNRGKMMFIDLCIIIAIYDDYNDDNNDNDSDDDGGGGIVDDNDSDDVMVMMVVMVMVN